MDKFPTSLLSIVFQLYLIESVFADEQVRRAQEELHKRHLFYGDNTGEITPAFTAAVSVYQQKKGFPRTGHLNIETLASLGLVQAPVKSAEPETPVVLAKSGELRDANGEALPAPPIAYRSSEVAVAESGDGADAAEIAITTAGDDAASLKVQRAGNTHPRVRPRRSHPPKDTNPFVLAFNSVDHAIRLLVGDAQPKKKRFVASRL